MRALLVVIGLILLALAGCTTRSRVTGVSIIEVPPELQKWTPAIYDDYGRVIGASAADDASVAPVLWLWGNGRANLVAASFDVRCPAGLYSLPAHDARANYLGTWTPVAPLPNSFETIAGTLAWTSADTLGLVSGRFVASFVDSDSTIRGYAQMTVGSPCNPSIPDTTNRTYFTLRRALP